MTISPDRPAEPDPALIQAAAPIAWADILNQPAPADGQRLAYGEDPEQFGILRLAEGNTPQPVVVLIHGGCWLADYGYQYFEHWAAWLQQQGYATWNIEYRRLGNGGGWPHSFDDVMQAVNHLAQLNDDRLDLSQTLVAGHSAGGHLALWLGNHQQAPRASQQSLADSIQISGIVGLAAISDLETYRIGKPGSCHASVDQLLGGSPADVPTRYAASSPLQRLPLPVPTVMISGEHDGIVSATSAQHFSDAAQHSGSLVQHRRLPGLGHFDLGAPTPASALAMQQALDWIGQQ